jgi:hypothetical protein
MYCGRFFGAVMTTTLFAAGSALAQGRTWEWDWSMHPMMFMWGAGGIVMMLMIGLRWLVGPRTSRGA